jgi:cytoskeletal protein CcmA (bactofilin family)
LEITKSGRVQGDLTGGSVLIEEGSSYQGKVRVEGKGQKTEEDEESVEIVDDSQAETAQPSMF